MKLSMFLRHLAAFALVAASLCMPARCVAQEAAGHSSAASLTVSVSLRPALDRGHSVTRTEVILSEHGNSLSRALTLDAQGQTASARFDTLAPGRYQLDLRVYERATIIGGGSGDIDVSPGVSNSVVVVFATFESTFLMNLAARTGLPFDLPTEAQWEYACRAGTRKAYNNDTDCQVAEMNDELGDSNLEPLAWYGHNWPGQASGIGTRRVGLKQANAWGLYDMHGNVWELCLDWYGGAPVDATDPVGPPSGTKRVARGGSYHAWPAICRSAERMPAREQFQATGFRLVCPDRSGDPAKLYMMVDLTAGPGAESYPVRYVDTAPADLSSNDSFRTSQFVLRRVPAGTFLMGSPPEELGRNDNEPQHSVTLSEGFYIGVFEVTQGQWHAVMGTNPSRFVGDTLPVETITWQDDIRGGFWPPRP
jgi:formylglycine-generating enzyme required for sulfatase activity